MSQENVEVVRRWWEGFNEDGMPPLALCDEESKSETRRTSRSVACSGVIRRSPLARPSLRHIRQSAGGAGGIVDVRGDGETVLMLLRATGTASYTGIEVRLRVGAVWTIRDGKVLQAQGYVNRDEALEAAGLAE